MTRLPGWLAVLAALLLSAVFGLAACGGDNNEEEISNAVSEFILSEDPRQFCGELITERFRDEVFDDLETCEKAQTRDEDDGEPPEEVTVSQIEIDGDKATAKATEVGGETDGASGEVELVKVDGAWRVDGLGIDFLRSKLDRGFANEENFADAEEAGPLADAEVRECFRKSLQDIDDEQFRQFAYDGIAERDDEMSPTVAEAIIDCMAEPGSGDGEVSLLRLQFEQGIRESAGADNVSEKQVDCVIAKLRETVSDQEIVDEVGKGGGGKEVTPELARKTAEAMAGC